MVSGTYVLTDSIDKAFDSIFTESRAGSTAVITGKSAFDISEGSGVTAPLLDESLLEQVREVPGVGAAEGSVDGEAQLIGDDGKAIVYGGAPNLGFSIADGDSVFNPLTLIEGGWPGTGEVAIDKATADKENFAIGKVIGVQGDGPVERLRISGIFRFGSVSTIGGATLAGFDLPTAQKIFDKAGKLDEIAVAAEPGVTDDGARPGDRGRPAADRGGQARLRAGGGGRGRDERVHHLPPGLPARLRGHRALRRQLRDRELALDHDRPAHARVRDDPDARRLATPGARLDRGRVARRRNARVDHRSRLRPRAREGALQALRPVGFTLPNQGLLLETRTIVVSLLVGILVTLVASLRPAIRATRVPPIAAVREGATLPESRFARFRTVGSLGLTALGFAALAFGLFGSDLGTTQVLLWMGVGALLIFIGVALFSARLVRPLATLLGAPAAQFGGAAGKLARDNARRNPQRTASTAAALMIGLALVTLVATLAAGITSTFRGAVDEIFTSDYAITAQNNFSPIPTDAAEAVAKVPGVEAIASTRTGEARIFDNTEFVTAVDPDADQVLTLRLEGRLAADARHARRRRRVRGRRLRRGPRPARRLADHGPGAVGEHAAAAR